MCDNVSRSQRKTCVELIYDIRLDYGRYEDESKVVVL